MSNLFGTAKVFAFLILLFVIGYQVDAQTHASSIYQLPAGTKIKLRMQGDIGSKFSSVSDTFLTRVAVPVVIRGVTVLPAGTIVEGRVISVTRAGLGSRNGHIEIRMETLKFGDDVDRSIEGVPLNEFEAKRGGKLLPVIGGTVIGAAVGFALGSAPGAAIGAGVGGGIGAGASFSRKGNEVRLKVDDVFEIELRKEVVLPVLDY
jgi:hypothetical protein